MALVDSTSFVVQLEVLGAQCLPRADLVGSIDAFVEVRHGAQVVHTTAVAHKSRNPLWSGEAVAFAVARSQERWLVELAVFDWDRVKANHIVAKASVEVPSDELWHDVHVALQSPGTPASSRASSTTSSSASSSSTWSSTSGASPEASAPSASSTSSTSSASSFGSVHVRLRRVARATILRQFWREALTKFDADNSGCALLVSSDRLS